MSIFRLFLLFDRRQRRGILLLAILLLLILAGQGALKYHLRQSQGLGAAADSLQQQALKEYRAFAATLEERIPEKRKSPYHREEVPAVLTDFDPNRADSTTLHRLGLPGWMARNVVNYRKKGGRFRKADDFRKIYGLTEEQFQRLRPYIQIAPADTASLRPASQVAPLLVRQDSFPVKYKPGTRIDLNKADTSELKKIPGIGSGIARRIVAYRARLGGFYRVQQLREIHLDDARLSEWFTVDAKDIRRLKANQAGVEQLMRHPYIDFYQARLLVEYRRKNGSLSSLKPFKLYEEFGQDDLERLSHYLDFGQP